jgi:hypothetical protein
LFERIDVKRIEQENPPTPVASCARPAHPLIIIHMIDSPWCNSMNPRIAIVDSTALGSAVGGGTTRCVEHGSTRAARPALRHHLLDQTVAARAIKSVSDVEGWRQASCVSSVS